MPLLLPGPRLLAALAATLVALPAQAEEVLRVSGTGTALGTLARLGAIFEGTHPDLKLRILPSVGSSGALQAVAKGAIEVGISGRPLNAEEVSLGLRAALYARTPFLFAVGPAVDVESVTLAEVTRIYRGEQARWPGGERVRVVLRPRTDVDTALLASISPELAAAQEQAQARAGMLMAPTNKDCHQLLRHAPGAFGPSSLSQVLTDDDPPRVLALDGVAPTTANLASGRYPLSKPLYLVVGREASPGVRAFVAFLRTAEARRVLEATGNLPVALPDGW